MSFRKRFRSLLYAAPLLDSLFRRFVWSRVHFPEHELKVLDGLRGLGTVIDVGAATGNYSWVLARRARRVVAFEPGDEHFHRLRLGANGSRITPLKYAVGEDSRRVKFFKPDDTVDGLHSATCSSDNPVIGSAEVSEIEQVSIDEIVDSEGIEDIDLIKIDVEGYENQVVRGALRTISRFEPVVICEIEERHNPDWFFCFEQLQERGYRAFFFRDGEYRAFEDPALIDEIQSAENRRKRLQGDLSADYCNNFVFVKTKTHCDWFGITK